jgi:DNA replication protein DnaC
VVWRYAPELVAEVLDREYHVDGQRLQRFMDEPVLIVDELGAVTGWMVGAVLEPLFDGRYRRRLPTVVTLLAEPRDVRAHFSDAIGRRFEDAQLCRVVRNHAGPWRAPIETSGSRWEPSPGPPPLRVVR